MANLQVDQALGATAQSVKDQNGNSSSLALSTDNVGIGTTAPVTKLEIAGNWTGDEGALRLTGDKPTIRFTGGALAGSQSWILHLGSDGPGNLEFFIRTGSGTWANVLSLTPGCNVGIGMANPQEKLEVDGNILVTGDVKLAGGDCAEEFNVDESQGLEPGLVMVIGDEDKLRQCTQAYDKRVAGVLSGAGDLRPGIVLGKQQAHDTWMPLALTGKVFCKVDARYAPIEVGDLLTTSPTPGHAMKATDPLQAFGAVIGKALRPLTQGQGLIPILIALR
jgi:hypothetical protein